MTSLARLEGTIDAATLRNLREGCNTLRVGQLDLIVHKSGRELVVYNNRCQHQGGRFVTDVEDANVAQCSRHGWRFDTRTGKYTNPPPRDGKACFVQERYKIAYNRAGDAEIYAEQVVATRENTVIFNGDELVTTLRRQKLGAGELTITYYGHACVIIKCGNYKIATDPWLIGDAFLGGWYPLHKPPKSWKKDLAAVDMIYISHRHPDHYHPETLALIAKENSSIPIIVGELEKGTVTDSFLPFSTVYKQTLGAWRDVKEDLRLAILQDGALNDLDTSLLIEYKGHTIFNYVDCGNPNFGMLGKFDVVLGDFAAGASGYPMCMMGAKYSDRFIQLKKKQMNHTYLAKTIDILQKTQPRVFVPFAGYFTEQRPEDGRIRTLNTKNLPRDVVEIVNQRLPDKVRVYVPIPGRTLDLSMPVPYISYPGPEHFMKYKTKDVRKILKRYSERTKYFTPFTRYRDEALKFYFEWAGFKSYDLVLQIQECDDDFVPCCAPFFVDFRHGLAYPKCIEEGATYEILHVRRDPFRYCLRFGLGWDSFFIGFSTRIERAPDVYHFELWNHMSNKLPKSPADWSAFLESLAPRRDRYCRKLLHETIIVLFAICAAFLMVYLG